MNKVKPIAPVSADDTNARSTPLHRSGAVARMLRMPVATLRVWERRYRLTQSELTPSGQRLYSADDVQRLCLLKQLTDLGHAIGSLAALDMPQLQRVAATHAGALMASRADALPAPTDVPPRRAWRLMVVGSALGVRLQRPTVLRAIGLAVELIGPFESATQAGAASAAQDADAVLVHEQHLHDDWLEDLEAHMPAFQSLPKAVLYSFAADPVCNRLASRGVALLREPQPDAVLAQWLRSLAVTATRLSAAAGALGLATGSISQRRWDDAALADFAGLSSTVACECPRHMAELLMLLSHFEAYSAECERRSPSDAELHAYLNQVAATARIEFEQALEHLALHEGLLLPRPDPGADSGKSARQPIKPITAARARARRGSP